MPWRGVAWDGHVEERGWAYQPGLAYTQGAASPLHWPKAPPRGTLQWPFLAPLLPPSSQQGTSITPMRRLLILALDAGEPEPVDVKAGDAVLVRGAIAFLLKEAGLGELVDE